MLNNWKRRIRYTDGGRLEIDNNWIENQIRPVALGSKNYLFAGSRNDDCFFAGGNGQTAPSRTGCIRRLLPQVKYCFSPFEKDPQPAHNYELNDKEPVFGWRFYLRWFFD